MLGRSEWSAMARRIALFFSRELTRAPIVAPQLCGVLFVSVCVLGCSLTYCYGAVAVDSMVRTPKQLVIALPGAKTEKKGLIFVLFQAHMCFCAGEGKVTISSGADDLVAILRLANAKFVPNKVVILVDDTSRAWLAEQNAFLGSGDRLCVLCSLGPDVLCLRVQSRPRTARRPRTCASTSRVSCPPATWPRSPSSSACDFAIALVNCYCVTIFDCKLMN